MNEITLRHVVVKIDRRTATVEMRVRIGRMSKSECETVARIFADNPGIRGDKEPVFWKNKCQDMRLCELGYGCDLVLYISGNPGDESRRFFVTLADAEQVFVDEMTLYLDSSCVRPYVKQFALAPDHDVTRIWHQVGESVDWWDTERIDLTIKHCLPGIRYVKRVGSVLFGNTTGGEWVALDSATDLVTSLSGQILEDGDDFPVVSMILEDEVSYACHYWAEKDCLVLDNLGTQLVEKHGCTCRTVKLSVIEEHGKYVRLRINQLFKFEKTAILKMYSDAKPHSYRATPKTGSDEYSTLYYAEIRVFDPHGWLSEIDPSKMYNISLAIVPDEIEPRFVFDVKGANAIDDEEEEFKMDRYTWSKIDRISISSMLGCEHRYEAEYTRDYVRHTIRGGYFDKVLLIQTVRDGGRAYPMSKIVRYSDFAGVPQYHKYTFYAVTHDYVGGNDILVVGVSDLAEKEFGDPTSNRDILDIVRRSLPANGELESWKPAAPQVVVSAPRCSGPFPMFRTLPGIQNVIFNDPAVVILWADGTKTIVKAQKGEKYDPEKGFAMAISKKALGNGSKYYDTFKKYVPEKKKPTKKKTPPKKKPSGGSDSQ